jgi:glutaredoxin
MSEAIVIVYGADWCIDCRRAKRFLNNHDIPFRWINIDGNADAQAFVRGLNHGNCSIPTILFDDGSMLVEPSTQELELKFGLIRA